VTGSAWKVSSSRRTLVLQYSAARSDYGTRGWMSSMWSEEVIQIGVQLIPVRDAGRPPPARQVTAASAFV
jgi:hypothetical protein